MIQSTPLASRRPEQPGGVRMQEPVIVVGTGPVHFLQGAVQSAGDAPKVEHAAFSPAHGIRQPRKSVCRIDIVGRS